MEIGDLLLNKKKYYINYRGPGHKGHDPFKQSQEFALSKASEYGFITNGWNINQIDPRFIESNKSIFSLSRGAGFWIWKPYIILETLKKMEDGDYLIYMDSGAYLIKSPDDYLRMIDHKGILTFSLGIHRQSTWCKKDCFEKVFGQDYDYSDHLQILASFLFIRKCEFSVRFIEEWLELCTDYQLVTDSPSVSTNYSDFREHRHDQALLSLLVYKRDIMYLPDITQWCFESGFDIESRKIVEHHRQSH